MTWWEAAFLGFLQGATEFLPVSSSGHLVLGQVLLGIDLPGIGFEVMLHLATLISVLIVYRVRLGKLLVGTVQRDSDSLRYVGLLVAASVPAAVVGLGFGDFLESLFESPWVTGVALLVTGVVLRSAAPALERKPDRQPGFVDALVMGFAQAAAIVPGISRSGSTVVAALWRRVEAEEAAAFSFLMSIPAVGGAAVLKMPDMAAEATGDWTPLLIGSLVALVTGVAAIKTFVIMLRRKSFHAFAPYVWGVGSLFLVYLYFG